MLAALIIVFREVLEAGLIVGVVLAASQGVAGRNRAVLIGLFAGIVGSLAVALFAARISELFEGRGQEFFAAAVLAFAVLMLTWHVVWMAEHAREMTARLRQLSSDVSGGRRTLFALGAAVGLAVMREGSEVVLFLSGIFVQGHDKIGDLALGCAGGLALGMLASAIVYFGLARIPLKQMFGVTGALITFLAAGLAAQAVHQLSNAGVLNVFDQPLWDSSWLISENSWAGRVVHVLVGYMDRPTGMQVIVYLLTLVAIGSLLWSRSRSNRHLPSLDRVGDRVSR